jgi:hypothetical protein
MKIFYITITLSILITAQSTGFAGARFQAMGASGAVLQGPWSVFHNNAGAAEVKSPTVIGGYNYHYLPSLSTAVLGVIVPSKYGVLNLNLSRFGNQLFNLQQIGLGIAQKFGNTALGLRVRYNQYAFRNLGSKGFLVFDAGGITQLLPVLWVGAFITNLSQTKLSSFEDERIPTVMYLGFQYVPIGKLTLLAEVEKDVELSPLFKTGLEYQFLESFHFRVGVSSRPVIMHLGLGLKKKAWQIDYAISRHPVLNMSHQLSLAHQFHKDD